MEILINNPISLMYAPYFLAFYGGVIVSVGIVANLIIQGNKIGTEAIPTHPDPYEIAYLREGEKAVIELACLNLAQRGLITTEVNHIENITGDAVNTAMVSAIEEAVYDYLATPRTVAALTNSLSLKNDLAIHCQKYKDSLIKQKYLNSDLKRYIVGGIGAFIVLSLGSYKMISALSRGHHNILFLLIMAIAATFWLGIISSPLYSRHTAKGKKYLASLRQVFGKLPSGLKTPPSQPDYNTALLTASHNLGAIEKSSTEEYASLINLFTVKKSLRSSRSTISSSSYGCSSSSCGSSCGGGCGGCGGCGG
ncbi:MAG: TIGR04222 domain-containing membrane protein [Pleurocapsa sp.]